MTDTFAENAKDALDIRLDEKGGFDELVAKDPRIVHVEVLDNRCLYLSVDCSDGRSFQLWVHGKKQDCHYEVSGEQIAENANCSGWLPIESAPKDGTVIDLWCGNRDSGLADRFPDSYFRSDHQRWCACDYGILAIAPTHWRPLPLPPEDV